MTLFSKIGYWLLFLLCLFAIAVGIFQLGIFAGYLAYTDDAHQIPFEAEQWLMIGAAVLACGVLWRLIKQLPKQLGLANNEPK